MITTRSLSPTEKVVHICKPLDESPAHFTIEGLHITRHDFIFLKIYIHGDFTYSEHVKKQILINSIIN